MHVDDPLVWYADYCAVPVDFLRTLPVEARDEKLAFTFAGSEAAKTRSPGEKQWYWEPEGAAIPPLWPVPEESLREGIWLTEGESDRVVAAITDCRPTRSPKAPRP